MNRTDKTRSAPGGLLYLSPGYRIDRLEAALESGRIECRPAGQLLDRGAVPELPTVVLVDDSLVQHAPELGRLPQHVVIVAASPAAQVALEPADHLSVATLHDRQAIGQVLRIAFQLSESRVHAASAQLELTRARSELRELNHIGMELMTERDHDALIRRILEQAMQLTQSDTGSLFLVEANEQHSPYLRFKLIRCDSVPELPPLDQETAPIDSTSLVGYAAMTGRPIVIDDAHDLPADAPYTLNRKYERLFKYWRKSHLVIPMVNHRDDVVGVLMLANRKSDRDAVIRTREDADRYVLPYTDREVQLGFSLAGQAAVSIENVQLYAQIEKLFESFATAAVTAIDQRDPTTSGHSVRVAALTTGLAAAVERVQTGAYRAVRFTREQMRELHYAALLHDFGKIGVREDVLVKAKKLPPVLWERVASRFDLIRCRLEMEYHRKRADLTASGELSPHFAARLDDEFREQIARLDQYELAVRGANEPDVSPTTTAEILDEISQQSFQ
ncbi:MAG: HD-GYP domain-containing protein, partial [Longimicrobiales bacterium]